MTGIIWLRFKTGPAAGRRVVAPTNWTPEGGMIVPDVPPAAGLFGYIKEPGGFGALTTTKYVLDHVDKFTDGTAEVWMVPDAGH